MGQQIGPERTRTACGAALMIVFVASLLSASGSAEGVASESPAAATPAADPVPLSESKVAPSAAISPATSATLVKRHFDGSLEQLDRRPEAAVLDLLGLTAQERAAADTLLTERAARVSTLATEHAMLLMSLQGSRGSGGLPEDLRRKMHEFREAAAGLLNPPEEDHGRADAGPATRVDGGHAGALSRLRVMTDGAKARTRSAREREGNTPLRAIVSIASKDDAARIETLELTVAP